MNGSKKSALRHAKTLIVLAVISVPVAGFASEPAPLGLPAIPVLSTHPQTPEKIALGKRLFSDTRFSADGSISCASCHDPKKSFADRLPVAEGIRKQKGTRNAPTLINAVFLTSQFWDGRRASLEEQANDPFVNAREHGLPDHAAVLAVVRRDEKYREAFKRAFGVNADQIEMSHVTQAIAAFERTLVAGNSAFDRFEFGGNRNALTPSAQRGLDLFRGRAGCVACHVIGKDSALFTDNEFHSSGVGFDRIQPRLAELTARVMRDRGENVTTVSGAASVQKLDQLVFTDLDVAELGRFVVTGKPSDIGKFKTPSLRNVALTAPYMHNGLIASLKDVIEIELYVRGGEFNRPVIITPAEKNDLVEFLQALTSTNLPTE